MDCVDIRNFGSGNDAGDFEVAFFSRGGADTNCLIGKSDVEGITVCLRVHSYGLNAELLADADDPEGYLPSICNEDFFEHS